MNAARLHRLTHRCLGRALVALGTSATGVLAQDVRNSADHPLFPNRMPGYSISNYQQQGFSAYRFRTRPPQEIEGKYTRIHYYLRDPAQHPGGLAIRRNYENAIKAAGGEVLFSDDNVSVMRVTRQGVEVWAEVQASLRNTGRIYFLHIVERTAMEQVITAAAMASAIERDGFVALDVRFATDKAEVLPESQPLLAEMAAMLTRYATLRVNVEGHTDNTGTAARNRALSEARARSVVEALVAAGISRDRLTPVGYGQDKPVADNQTEEGRARNRRVVLSKRTGS
jgi:outer membrane protein OmpA-like peptidoglycan-associated protein